MKRHLTKLFFLALLPLALSAQACSTYSYYDLDLQVSAGFTVQTKGDVSDCHLFVSGAANDDFKLDFNICHTIDPNGEIGMIQYSTLADSGNLTFTLRLFEMGKETPGCQIGIGSVTLPVEPGKTSALTVLKVPYNAPTDCTP